MPDNTAWKWEPGGHDGKFDDPVRGEVVAAVLKATAAFNAGAPITLREKMLMIMTARCMYDYIKHMEKEHG